MAETDKTIYRDNLLLQNNEKDKTDSKPMEKKRSVSLEKLLQQIKELASIIEKPPYLRGVDRLWNAYAALEQSKVRGSKCAEGGTCPIFRRGNSRIALPASSTIFSLHTDTE